LEPYPKLYWDEILPPDKVSRLKILQETDEVRLTKWRGWIIRGARGRGAVRQL